MGEIFFNTSDVAEMLRVDKSTVKRWANEGKLKCFRTPGGHRKFHADEVYNFVTQFHYEISTLQVVPDLASDDAIIKKMIEKKEFNVLMSVCFNVALKGKKDDVLSLFVATHRAGLSVAKIFDFILIPALKKISDTYSINKISFLEYQLAQRTLTSAVLQLTPSITHRSHNNKTIICASFENHFQDVEMAAIITLFETEGYTVLNLGSGMTATAVAQMVYRTKPFAVCIHSSNETQKEQLIEDLVQLQMIVRDSASKLVCHGRSFQSPDVQTQISHAHFCFTFSDFLSLKQQENISNVGKEK